MSLQKLSCKIKEDNSGSTLLLIIITISMLTVLGTILLSAIITQTKINVMYNKQRQNLYYAESGLEEAYAITGKKLEEAISHAKEEADEGLVTETSKDKYYNEDGSLNENMISEYYNNKFEDSFTTFINNINFINLLSDSSNYQCSNQSKKLNIKVLSIKKFNDSNNEYTLNYQSTFQTIDGLKKAINADIIITSEKIPIKISTVKKAFVGVPIWKYALATDKDIIINGPCNVNVTGDVFSYGTVNQDSIKPNIVDISEYKGIILNSNNSEMTIDGNLITNSTIQTKGINSKISLSKGNIICNSLAVQGKNSIIEVNEGNVFTKDDIELNGTGGIISIDGSYYGFSTGGDSEKHDSSSCISINVPSYVNGKQVFGTPANGFLKITGSHNDYTPYKNGIFIGGTSHVHFNENKNYTYVSGESISIKGNYFIYSVENNNMYSKYHHSKIGFKNYIYNGNIISLAHEYKSDKPLSIIDKSKYFLEIINTPPYEKLINIGSSDSDYGIDIPKPDYNNPDNNKILKMAGLMIYREAGNNKVTLYPVVNEAAEYIEQDAPILYNNYISYMHSNRNDYLSDNKLPIEQYFTYTENIPRNLESNANIIEDDIMYINNNENNVLWIKGTNSPNSLSNVNENITCISYTNNSQIKKGIIVAKGDIYITGNVNFTGAIITTGNIYIHGSGNKNIINDKAYLEQLITNNPNLRYQFRNGYEVKASTSQINTTNADINLDGFINIRNWRIN
jgi:type II secretory pathway pseudopilin PulG